MTLAAAQDDIVSFKTSTVHLKKWLIRKVTSFRSEPEAWNVKSRLLMMFARGMVLVVYNAITQCSSTGVRIVMMLN